VTFLSEIPTNADLFLMLEICLEKEPPYVN
jgi:hypothetical protein